MKFRTKLKYGSIFLAIIVLVLFVFWDLPQTFFQQDEWQFFGSIIHALDSERPFLNIILPFGGGLTHFFPLSNLFFLLEYISFKINFTPYAIINIFLHLINSFLVFWLLRQVSRQQIVAFLASLLFAVNSISHQAVSWVANVIGTLPATLFLLLSLIFYIRYLQNENRAMYFIVSLVFLVVSLFFKETGVFLFIFFPLIWLIYNFSNVKAKFKRVKKSFLALLSLGGFYILLRLFLFFFGFTSSQPEVVDVSIVPLPVYFYRLFTIPLRVISQSIFPAKMILEWSRKIIYLAYPQFIASDGVANPYLVESVVADLVGYSLTLIILLLSLVIFKYLTRRKEKDLVKVLVFSLFFVLTSSLPFIFVPGRAGYFSIFEPRNLYIPVIGSSLMIAIFFYFLASLISKKPQMVNFLVALLLMPLLIFHIKSVKADLKKLEAISQLRKSFLITIQDGYPQLPTKTIFYTQSDTPYYGMPESEKILPVQSGFGRMLMVLYQASEKFPGCLYENQFLHDLISQGYRECQGRGFGYFREYDKLVETLKTNDLSPNDVFAFSWSGKSEEFKNITNEIRERLRKER